MRLPVIALLAAATLSVAACGTANPDQVGLLTPFRPEMPQGNYLTQEMLDQVKVGMTREQVRFALGVPLLVPLFRDDRWNYVFRYRFRDGRIELRRVVLFFADERLARIDADPLPVRDDPNDPALPGFRPATAAQR